MIDQNILRWKMFAASSGPGGQHVNKVATAVELRCAVKDLGLPEQIEERFRMLAGRKLTDEGEIVIVAKEHASQVRNKVEALERLEELVAQARKLPKKRRPTRPTKASGQRRLVGKKIRANIKKLRRGGDE